MAIDHLRGPVIRLVLSSQDWEGRPNRLRVAQRVVRLGFFTSQPLNLLTAICDNGNRVDLLTVAPHTEPDIAEAAMRLAATADNLVHAQHIVDHLNGSRPANPGGAGQHGWEDDGGQ